MDNIVELAKIYGSTLSGHVSEWPQLQPLLLKLAERIEVLEKRLDELYKIIDNNI